MEPHTIIDTFASLANGILWSFATVVAFLRLKNNHLEGVEKLIYLFGGLAASVYAIVNILFIFTGFSEIDRAHNLQVIEPFIGASLILFMLFYRNKKIK